MRAFWRAFLDLKATAGWYTEDRRQCVRYDCAPRKTVNPSLAAVIEKLVRRSIEARVQSEESGAVSYV
jgi:hypothetical protein